MFAGADTTEALPVTLSDGPSAEATARALVQMTERNPCELFTQDALGGPAGDGRDAHGAAGSRVGTRVGELTRARPGTSVASGSRPGRRQATMLFACTPAVSASRRPRGPALTHHSGCWWAPIPRRAHERTAV
jgi:hypothetical protein